MMGPYKCPDCGVWWAGFEHKCQLPISTTTTVINWNHCCVCSRYECDNNTAGRCSSPNRCAKHTTVPFNFDQWTYTKADQDLHPITVTYSYR